MLAPMRWPLGIELAAILAGCWSGSESAPTPRKESEPKVDMTCVIRGEQGTLLIGLPETVAGFTVTKAALGVHLHRPGRALGDVEARALWQTLGSEWFVRGGLAGGSIGVDSVYRCTDVGPGGCFTLEAWICQRPLEDIAATFAEVVAAHGAGDMAASLDIDYLETRGPRCQASEDCAPQPHYSTRVPYDPLRGRFDLREGTGACRGDGDCNASQACQAWYLSGGAELAYYRQYSTPRYCGCIAHRCTWFEQP